jgi:hypothetical protein
MSEEFLPTRERSMQGGRSIDEYPNTLTGESISKEMESRLEQGFSPEIAIETVIEGLDNWIVSERKNYG